MFRITRQQAILQFVTRAKYKASGARKQRSKVTRSRILKDNRSKPGFNLNMARFSHILFAAIFVMASLSAAEAQAARPNFPGRPQPVQPSMKPAPGVATGHPAQPQPQQQSAPIKPSANTVPQAEGNNAPATPASPPTVSYRDGLLKVEALNSTLSSVLAAIRSKTGIDFEGPQNSSDRVALSLGPAPAGEVLSAIFAGSRFDFVAIGRPDNPNIVQHVILTPKTQPGAVAAAQPQQPSSNGQQADEEETPDETPNAEPQDTAAQPAPVPQPEPQQPQGPKTQEQLLQELQQMKRQQMQQEGAPPPNPAQVPRKPPM